MKRLLPYSVFLTVALLCGKALAQDSSRQLSVLMVVKGTCSTLVLTGESLPCEVTLIHTEYDDGRIDFYFAAAVPEGKIITFSGRGQDQQAPSENVRIQPVDAVILSNGIFHVSGECLFENPFDGQARIQCAAKSVASDEYLGQFLTDGHEPSIMNLGADND
ncbi:MAG: hypothetical protein NXI27_30315 [Alphaproteobacteria bacterium]|nr:hypothetical protein [Alphaproteobacteria bacterium]